MDVMLCDVIIYGIVVKVFVVFKCQDLVGKMGMINEYIDVWFCGYQMIVVGCVWIGFDQFKKLGDKEIGGVVVLLIWIGYMSCVFKDVLMQIFEMLDGFVRFGEGCECSYIYMENIIMYLLVEEILMLEF